MEKIVKILKKIKIKNLLILIFLLIFNTYAWFIYATRVSTNLTAHVSSWNIEFVSGTGEITTNLLIEVDRIYPGMDKFEKSVEVHNKGETAAVLEYEIESLRTSNNFKYFIRKLFGHFGAYFILGFITFITFNIFWSNKTKTLIWSLIFGVVFSIITELLQFIPIGRYPSVKDVVINFTGYINGTLIILVIYVVYTKIKERKISSN